MLRALLNPVAAAGSAEAGREPAEMSQDVGLVGDRALRRAPAGFDPAAIAQSVLIEDWVIEELPAPKCEVIVGTVWHHPHAADGRRIHTTDLIWIDEGLGWARSLFRFYRLGQRATSISSMAAAPPRLQPQNHAR